MLHEEEMQQDVGVACFSLTSCCFLFLPLWDGEAAVNMCITANVLSVSVLILSVTDGDAESGELDLSGIDDTEIELYLLSDTEIKVKTALWMADNSDYLKEQKEKEAKIAKEKALGIYKERKPKGPKRKYPPISASTADEAIGKMLEQKKISTKINYDVLKDLNIKPCPSPARVPLTPKKEPSATKLTGRNRNPVRAPLSLSTPLSTLGKRGAEVTLGNIKTRVKEEKFVKVVRLEGNHST
ncbi:hypothetical protein NQZ68_017299 [Dissostichus eleginoides]|nr:hypothetical protein NQZ68_017299 [Dissostichus eleginoides]